MESPSPETRNTSVSEFVSLPDTGRLEVVGLHGSAGAYLLAERLKSQQRMMVLVTAEESQAARLAEDLSFYLGRSDRVGHLPAWEIFPFEPLVPHPDVEARRIAVLHRLQQGQLKALVCSVRGLMQRMIPGRALSDLCLPLHLGQDYERSRLLKHLDSLGYQPVPLVEDRGGFSTRGDLLDLFPPTLDQPVRLEFFGDQLERIRPFDPASQRTLDRELRELSLLPSREMVLTGDALKVFEQRFRELCDTQELPRSQRAPVLEELQEGIVSPGRCFLLPLNYREGLNSLFDYIEDATWVVIDPPAVERAGDAFADEIREGHQRLQERGEPVVPHNDLFQLPDQIWPRLENCRRINLMELELYRMEEDQAPCRFQARGNGDLRLTEHDGAGIERLTNRLRQWQEDQWRLLLVCHREGQARRLLELLEPYGIRPDYDPQRPVGTLAKGGLQLILGDLSAGFRIPEERLAVIAEEELFGPRRRQRKRSKAQALLSSLAELKEGDFVVHADHGIGHYLGLKHLDLDTQTGDFMHLEYAGGDKLYLPVERIEKIGKYQGAEGHKPKLDKMGGQAWEKTKLKARAAVEELARQLLQIFAKREMRQGFAFSPPDRIYREFEAEFPFEETPDQAGAIDDVLEDMQSERPMDRLVCGDVGYGKTEVALRAAMKAVLDGKQVAVLVPTTILAEQHWQNFCRRLEEFPVEVEMVSRFRTAAETKVILQKLEAGQIDILVGTHRLLQRDVRFKDLGLLVIDEEQRFGVAHKEKLKQFRAEVDVLTLTATPIPRTLHMGLAGLRDLSVIDTPPVDRLAIRTYVTRYDDDLIRQAILRELRRAGQVFFVHNRVQTIGAMAEHIRTLVPEAKVAVGHGQMAEKELEKVILGFMDGESQVLVASTIIENGLDIPRANTIIVNRADCFGLSQLYQLRGRVGRSNRRAYAYLLIPGEGALTRDARERLRVLQELTELGAGFRVASHDLELRGAGDLLGAKQSGQIAAIGFEMYTELLEETIQSLKGQEMEDRIDPEIRLGLSAYLPESYVADPNQRLVLYQKLAGAESEEVVYEIVDELTDRYGALPPPTEILIRTMGLRVLLKRLKIELTDYDGRYLTLAFHAQTPVSPQTIAGLLENPDDGYRFTPDYRLMVPLGRLGTEELLVRVKKELHRLL